MDKPEIVVICGPTATGKTALGVQVAKVLDGEVIGADSMQIYDTLCVGTARATEAEMEGVPHHLVGFLPPDKTFSVADYVTLADEKIRAVRARGHVPVLVGGTGQYIESLVRGLRFTEQKTDPAVRERLQKRLQAEGIQPLYAELQQQDPAYAATVHPNNEKRVLRALELLEQTGMTMTQQKAASVPSEAPYRAHIFALTYADRAVLYTRINTRVDAMLANGLLDEAKTVYENRDAYVTAAQAIGYKEYFAYFEKQQTIDECTEACKQASRNYAKRQLTWFRRMEGVTWLEAGSPQNLSLILQAVGR